MRQTLTASSTATPDGHAFEYGLYNGRFQIVTEAHLHTAREMTARARRGIINIGSINRSRDTRNPFTFDERRAMWEAALGRDHDVVIGEGGSDLGEATPQQDAGKAGLEAEEESAEDVEATIGPAEPARS